MSGVDLSLAAAAEEPTTLAIAVPGAQGRAEYVFYVQGTADWQWRQDEMPTLPRPESTQSLRAGNQVDVGSLRPVVADVIVSGVAGVEQRHADLARQRSPGHQAASQHSLAPLELILAAHPH